MNGLHPVISAFSGRPSSRSSTWPNGNRARNDTSENRGSPQVVPTLPIPVSRRPNLFHSGTGPSSTRVPFCLFFRWIAANIWGSLKRSGSWRTDRCETAPVPSRQNMPAPIPPIGKATRWRLGYLMPDPGDSRYCLLLLVSPFGDPPPQGIKEAVLTSVPPKTIFLINVLLSFLFMCLSFKFLLFF